MMFPLNQTICTFIWLFLLSNLQGGCSLLQIDLSLSLYLCLVVHVPARADAQDSNLISPLLPLHSLNFRAKLCIA